jgi:hypothetical protein
MSTQQEIDHLYEFAIMFEREDAGKPHAFARVYQTLAELVPKLAAFEGAQVSPRHGLGEEITTCRAAGYALVVYSTHDYAHLVLHAPSSKSRGAIFYNNPHARDFHEVLRHAQK